MKQWSLNGVETINPSIVKVYDGDTLNIALPVCCQHYIFKCRLNNLDAPEIRSKNAQEKKLAYQVRDYVKELLTTNEFKVCCLGFDKYGRVLCDIYILPTNESLADHLINKGYAYTYNGGKKVPFDEWYKLSDNELV